MINHSKLYHVDGDYIPKRADISPPHWVCSTFKEAVELIDVIRATTKNVTNLHVRETGYE